MQASLFNDNSMQASGKRYDIVSIKSTGGKQLNKTQKQFNKLTKRISVLKNHIKELPEKQRKLQKIYDDEVYPHVVTLGEKKIKLAHLLHEKRQKVKLSKRVNEDLDDFIIDLLDDAFHVIAASENDKGLYDSYNEITYDAEVEQQRGNISQVFSDMIFEQTGRKISPEQINPENPEEFAKLMAEIGEQMKANDTTTKKRKQKSQRTIDKENREKQKEELKQKSLRSIYLSLAKILHPDIEKDEALKAEKEEYMKRVTVAYNNKNLPELFELEMQWVNKHENLLNKTPDETLILYNELLKDQVQNLEEELYINESNPTFDRVNHLVNLNPDHAFSRLMNDKKSYLATHQNYQQSIQNLEAGNRDKAIIIECLEKFFYTEDDNDFFQILTQLAAGKTRI